MHGLKWPINSTRIVYTRLVQHALERHEDAVKAMEELKVMYEGDEVVKHWYEQVIGHARNNM